MGFFKKAEPQPKKKKVRKVKTAPKFMTKKMKEKERYEVLGELFMDASLDEAKERNAALQEEKKRLEKLGEFAGAATITEVELRVPGCHRLDFMSLTELGSIGEEILTKRKVADAMVKEEEGKVKHEHKVRGLFDYKTDATTPNPVGKEGKASEKAKMGGTDAKKQMKTLAAFSSVKVEKALDLLKA